MSHFGITGPQVLFGCTFPILGRVLHHPVRRVLDCSIPDIYNGRYFCCAVSGFGISGFCRFSNFTSSDFPLYFAERGFGNADSWPWMSFTYSLCSFFFFFVEANATSLVRVQTEGDVY